MSLTIVRSTRAVRVGTSRNLLVAVWSELPIADDIVGLASAARALAREHPSGSGLLNLFVHGTPKFDDDRVRAELVRINNDPMAFPRGSARVILLPGFSGVAVRAFLNTITLLSKRVRPVQTFSSVREAASWLAPKLEDREKRWTPGEIEAIAAPFLPQAE